MTDMAPRAAQFPNFKMAPIHVPIDGNSLGVRAGGQASTAPVLAVIGNTVLHTPTPVGVEHLDMPYEAANI